MSIKFIELAGGLNYSSLCCAGLFRATLQTFNNLVGGERRRTRLQLKSEGFFPQELSLKRKCSATGNMVNVREEGSVVTVTAGSASMRNLVRKGWINKIWCAQGFIGIGNEGAPLQTPFPFANSVDHMNTQGSR